MIFFKYQIFTCQNFIDYFLKLVFCNGNQIFSVHLFCRFSATARGSAQLPKIGSYAAIRFAGRPLRLYRMPSSSRAYPLSLDKKAAYYKQMFLEIFSTR